MSGSHAYTRIKTDILKLVRDVPAGRITTYDAIGQHLGVTPRAVASLLSKLTEPEREMVPWHRVVAKGGAIGWGPMRDAQFANLVREGVTVSPAGVVHDVARVAIADLSQPQAAVTKPLQTAPAAAEPSKPLSRSRGMKDCPR